MNTYVFNSIDTLYNVLQTLNLTRAYFINMIKTKSDLNIVISFADILDTSKLTENMPTEDMDNEDFDQLHVLLTDSKYINNVLYFKVKNYLYTDIDIHHTGIDPIVNIITYLVQYDALNKVIFTDSDSNEDIKYALFQK